MVGNPGCVAVFRSKVDFDGLCLMHDTIIPY